MNSNKTPKSLSSSDLESQDSRSNTNHYIGRFAPSPTGPLHFGSLVSALASFLDARHNRGQWLLRIEDIDPPREEHGATENIIHCLQAHHLFWDGEILYQSQRQNAYQQIIKDLENLNLVYPCYCTRKQLEGENGIYPGTCRNSEPQNLPSSLRLRTSELASLAKCFTNTLPLFPNHFEDLIQGPISFKSNQGDFIVRRKDGLYAYQLAVVVDDAFQGVTHVIRGMDLLDSTPPQQFLFDLLGKPLPQFGHIPLVLNDQGQKLSKQNLATALNNDNCFSNLQAALHFLNHPPPKSLDKKSIDTLLQWAIENWDRRKVTN